VRLDDRRLIGDFGCSAGVNVLFGIEGVKLMEMRRIHRLQNEI